MFLFTRLMLLRQFREIIMLTRRARSIDAISVMRLIRPSSLMIRKDFVIDTMLVTLILPPKAFVIFVLRISVFGILP